MAEPRKHRFAIFCLLLALLPLPAAADALLWSLNANGRVAGYLLGTIHSEDPRVLEFDPTFLDRVEACDVFAMEIVPDLGTLQRLLEYMQLPPGQSLPGLIGAERFRRVADALARYGTPRAQARSMKPWAAMLTLSVPPPRTGLFMDYALALRAEGRGVDVRGLETLEQQLGFLESLDLERQLLLLDHAVAQFEHVDEVHGAMVEAYLAGSLERLQREALRELESLPADLSNWFLRRGIRDRNLRMHARAMEWIGSGECVMIAVGALHLPGEEGLVALLRDSGFDLTPLASPFAASATEAAETIQ